MLNVERGVRTVAISMLKVHPKNAEIYGEEDVTDLKQSIAESGWIKPLTVTPEYVIISGHRRYRAALELGYTRLPIEFETFASEEAEMERLLRENENREKLKEQQIREGMTWEPIEEAKAKQRMDTGGNSHAGMKNFTDPQSGNVRDIIARRVGLGSGVTYEKGKEVVLKIDEEVASGDIKERGRLLRIKLNDERSINASSKLIQNYEQIDREEEQKQKKEEEERSRRKELDHQNYLETLRKQEALRPKGVQQGQWWKLGSHLLYCGDSSSDVFVNRCKEVEAAFAFADPPYNAEVDEKWDGNFVWAHDYLIKLAPIVAVTPGISAIKDFMCRTTMPYKWSMSYWIDNGMTRGALGFGNWMYVALFTNTSLYRNAQDLVRIKDNDMGQVSIVGNDHDALKHKGRKPIELMQHLVTLFTSTGEMVIDPFLGTGTTLIACEQTGRCCIGAEQSTEYCEAIIKRWVVGTGRDAEIVL